MAAKKYIGVRKPNKPNSHSCALNGLEILSDTNNIGKNISPGSDRMTAHEMNKPILKISLRTFKLLVVRSKPPIAASINQLLISEADK